MNLWENSFTLDRIRRIDGICREKKPEKAKPNHYFLCNDLPDDLKKIFSEGHNYVVANGEYRFNMASSARCGFEFNSNDAIKSHGGNYIYYKKLLHLTIPESYAFQHWIPVKF